MDIQAMFTNLVNAVAPPLPKEVGGVKLREKVNSILAPTLLNTWLPPLPKAIAGNKVVQSISPTPVTQGPPLPSFTGISWPGFITRSTQRLVSEGPAAPYKTIKQKGLMAEIKREFELITGSKL
jgi:hypothetical protein